MTRQKAIRELGKLGYRFVANSGRFSAQFDKDGRKLIADPKDLLVEVQTDGPWQGAR